MTKSTEFSTIKDIYNFNYVEDRKIVDGTLMAVKKLAGKDLISVGLIGRLNGKMMEIRKFNMSTDNEDELDRYIKSCIEYIEDMCWLNDNVITYINDRTLSIKLDFAA